MRIDVCVVAGRRPELLEVTLSSFRTKLLQSLQIGKVFVNIDPVMGTTEDHNQCLCVVRSHYPHAIFFEPPVASFAGAVRRLWAATSARYILHLEDDWVALADIGWEALEPFADPYVAQVSFNTREKHWNVGKMGHYHRKREPIIVFGIRLGWRLTAPIFTTSPSFLRGSFARRSAQLMQAHLDPEKQFYNGTNPHLERYASKFKNYIFPTSGEILIKDIGRDWRRERGIEKKIVAGQSIWMSRELDRK